MLVVPEHVLSDDGKSTRRGPNGEWTITFSIPGFYKRIKFTILALLQLFIPLYLQFRFSFVPHDVSNSEIRYQWA